MAHYYDIVLTLIPTSLLGTAALLSIVGLPTSVAVPLGAMVAAVFIGHAMFVNGPETASDDASGTASQTGSATPISAD
ncbi:hypothetical protein [Halovivax limisalsi]|uniref:hypothetical protein n=1 Tax=Halovivax limisalsi TaxID=1453760 RepID=UPI001FFC63BE|nr:hypothetical protein [Halovivax limisalsi]